MTNKRGLSDVVTVALIVLLAVAAVVIVWSFVRPTLENIGSQINAACTTIDVKATSCSDNGDSVRVEVGSGQATVDGVKLVFYNAAGETIRSVTATTPCVNMAPLDVQSCGTTVNAGEQVGAAAIIGDVTCPVTQLKLACA